MTETIINPGGVTHTIIGIPGPLGNITSATGTINAVRDHGAKGDGITDDYAAIQGALDAAATNGGGSVFLPAGTYLCTNVLSVPSYTRLYGVGFDSIITNPAGDLPAKVLHGVNMYATIVSVGTIGAQVANLTIDHSVQGNSNGIQFGEYLAATPTSDGVIEECYVQARNIHAYNIYVKLADRMKVRNNISKGPATGTLDQDVAGIEVFGSNGSEIYGNTCMRCSEGIVIKSQTGIDGSAIVDVGVHDNIIKDCLNGLSVNVASGVDTFAKNIMVQNNTVTNSANLGVKIGLASGSISENLTLIDNNVYDAGSGAVVIYSDPLAQSDGLAMIGNTIIQSVSGTHGLQVFDADKVVVSNNTISGLQRNCVYIDSSSNVSIINNAFLGCEEEAVILINAPTRCSIINNTITNWGSNLVRVGISASGELHVFSNNFFNPHANSSGQYAIQAQHTTNSEISDNRIGWTTRNSAFVNGTGGRNNFGTDIRDRNLYQVSAIFPRKVGFNMAHDTELTDAVDMNGYIRMRNPTTPASATAPGERGQVRWDSGHIYICTSTDMWKRAALASW